MQVLKRTLTQPSAQGTYPCYDIDGSAVDTETFLWPEFYRLYELKSVDTKGPVTQWKPCQHYKRWAEYSPVDGDVECYTPLYPDKGLRVSIPHRPYTCYWGARTSNIGPPGYPFQGQPSWYSEQEGTDLIPPPSNLEELIAASIKTMRPGIKAELSLLNSIYELKDMKTLVRTKDKFVETWNSIRRMLASNQAKGVNKSILGSTAEAYLQQQFNLSPLVGDIVGIYKTLTTLEKRVKRILKSNGKVVTRHFLSELEPSTTIVDNWPPDSSTLHLTNLGVYGDYVCGDGRYHRTIEVSPSVFRAHCTMRYTLGKMEVEYARLFALLDSFGVNLNPAIVWNAIPWSFVVDWVVGVSQFLDDFKTRNLEPEVEILQYCWTLTKRRTARVNVSFDFYDGYDASRPMKSSYSMKMPVIHESAFRRDVVLPTSSLLTTSGVNLREVTLASALAYTRSDRKRSRRPRRPMPLFGK